MEARTEEEILELQLKIYNKYMEISKIQDKSEWQKIEAKRLYDQHDALSWALGFWENDDMFYL